MLISTDRIIDKCFEYHNPQLLQISSPSTLDLSTLRYSLPSVFLYDKRIDPLRTTLNGSEASSPTTPPRPTYLLRTPGILLSIDLGSRKLRTRGKFSDNYNFLFPRITGTDIQNKMFATKRLSKVYQLEPPECCSWS